jgi:hypothetical protein
MPRLPISAGRASEATRFAILRTLPARPALEIAMTLMILGLVLFLGSHSVRIVAELAHQAHRGDGRRLVAGGDSIVARVSC